MFETSGQFNEAVQDYLYLLDREYPLGSALKIVGDKYQLVSQERSMLFRGIIPKHQCLSRRKTIIQTVSARKDLYIDGYNVIRTIGSYLNGRAVFISMDSLLRDASEMHRASLNKEVMEKSENLLIEHLAAIPVKEVIIYLDYPVSKSGHLAERLNKKLCDFGLKGLAKTVHSPDHLLKEKTDGIICTADSAIIDHSYTKVYDLAHAILVKNYEPDFINFEKKYLLEK